MNRKMVLLVVSVISAAFVACATGAGLDSDQGRFSRVLLRDANMHPIGFVITGYTGTSSDIQIPARFRSAVNPLWGLTEGYPVIAIAARAFADMGLTSVTIPDTVRTIEEGAFFNNQLASVTIPGSVTTIGEGAFALNRLTSVTIPSSVTTIGRDAFAYNRSISSEGFEVALSGDGRSVWITGYAGEATDIRIPSQIQGMRVAGIASDAFAGQQLTSVVIDNGIGVIMQGAFRDNQLTNVTIPASVTTIGENAFAGNQLASMPITAQQQQQAEQQRRRDEVLAEHEQRQAELLVWHERRQAELMALPYSPESHFQVGPIGGGVSIRITGYTGSDWTVRIPSHIRGLPVTHIGAGAFRNRNLVGVTIPDTVTHIENNAFGDNQLTSVAIPSSVTSIARGAFSRNALTSITIPNGVTVIPQDAFRENPLVSIMIPDSVRTIEADAFLGLSSSGISLTIGSNVNFLALSAHPAIRFGAFVFDRHYIYHERRAGTYMLIDVDGDVFWVTQYRRYQ